MPGAECLRRVSHRGVDKEKQHQSPRPPTLSLGMMRSSEPCFKNTVPVKTGRHGSVNGHTVCDEEFCSEADQKLVSQSLDEADGQLKMTSFLHPVRFQDNLLVYIWLYIWLIQR